MKTLIAIILWLVLFAICWPLALLLIVVFPLLWLLLLPFTIVGLTLELVFKVITAIFLFPFKIIRAL